MYNRGGQRRTIQAGCGWCRTAHPTEVNRLYILHKKHCKEGCGSTEYEAPEFNKIAGNMNGWKGSTIKGCKTHQVQSTCLVDGKRIEVVSEASSVAEAVREMRLSENIDNIIAIAEAMPDQKKKSSKPKATEKKPEKVDDEEEEKKMKKMFQFANKLKELEWTDAEELNLPEKYTELMVHIALEKADTDKDEKNFYAILNGDTKYRTLMLIKHIEKTLGVFEWNFKTI